MNSKLLLCLALGLSSWLSSQDCPGAVIFPKGPAEGQPVAHKALAWFLQTNPNLLGGAQIGELTITNAYQIYNAGPQDVISGNLLSKSKPAAGRWRYFVLRGTNAVGAAELKTEKDILKFVALYHGFGPKMLEALRRAEELPQVKGQDYEFRFLNLAPMNFFAVWLHGESDDIIIPLPPTWEKWNPYQPYSEGEIVGILKPIMEEESAAWAKLGLRRQNNYDVNAVYTKAMMDYEKAHGGNCGTISFFSTNGPVQKVSSYVEIFTLQGMSSECGKLTYKVKVTYDDLFNDVKKVEILQKLASKYP